LTESIERVTIRRSDGEYVTVHVSHKELIDGSYLMEGDRFIGVNVMDADDRRFFRQVDELLVL